MKKISLILCAVALAGTAFFASCSNGSDNPEITFVNTTNNKNYYSVTGSYTVVEADNTVTNNVAGTSDVTETTVKTITKGYADISWSESKTHEGTSSGYSISFNGLKGTTNYQEKTGTNVTTAFATNPTEGSLNGVPNFTIYKIDDDFFYFTGDGQAVKLTAEELESGEDFTLDLTYSIVEDNLPSRLSTNTDVDTTTYTYTYKLSFKAAQ